VQRPVLAATESQQVHPWDIFVELGQRRVIAGQEDLIPDAARTLAAQGASR
jgi:4-hydroxy 2-oxovalerate aldolase